MLFLFLMISGVCAYSAKEIEANITQAIRSYLLDKEPAFKGADIKVNYKYAGKIFSGLAGRGDKVQFEVAELYPDFRPLGSIIVPIQVIENGVPKEKVFIRTVVEVMMNAAVAKRPLKKNDIIGTGEVEVKQVDIARIYTKTYYKSSEEVMGKEVKTYIPREFVIIDWMIAEKALIKKRDKIVIRSSIGDVAAFAEGEALEDGPAGAKIKVRNIGSGKVIFGTISGSKEVTVDSF